MPSTSCDADSQAIALHQQGRSDDALKLLRDAIKRTPERGSLWLVRAIIRHSTAQWSAALGDAEVAMTLMPLPVRGQLVLGDCYSHLGRRELALVSYEHLLTQGPLSADTYAELYSGFRRCCRNDLAIQACRAAVDADPDNHAAYFGMAHCMASLNYSATYIASVLRTAVELAPADAIYRTSLAIQLVRAGKPIEAHAELRRVAPTKLQQLDCVFSARKLMQLCVWADDCERAEILGTVISRLIGDRDRRTDPGSKKC